MDLSAGILPVHCLVMKHANS